jgi:hypothetical protein
MWNMKRFVIPVITVATGIATKDPQRYLGAILGKHSVYSVQKTAVLGAPHIISKVLQYEA